MLVIAAAFVGLAQGAFEPELGSNISSGLRGVFTENVGQWPESVLFHGQFSGYDVSVTTDQVVIHHYALEGSDQDFQPRARIASVAMAVGIGPFRSIEGRSPDSVQTSINGTPAKRFGELRIETGTPGVQMVLGATDGEMRYDLHLASGVPTAAAELSFEGAPFKVHPDEMVFGTALGEVRHGELKAFQDATRRPLPVRFAQRRGNVVGFEVEGRDLRQPVVIDPLIYSSYFGGRGADTTNAVDVGPTGHVFVGGNTFSVGFSPLGSISLVQSGYVAWFRPDKRLVSVIQFSGGSPTAVNDVVAHPDSGSAAGVAFFVGHSGGNLANFDDLSVHNGQTMGMVGRLQYSWDQTSSSSSIYLVSAGFFGGGGATSAKSVCLLNGGGSNEVIVVGSTASTAAWTSAIAVASKGTLGGTDAFLLKAVLPGSSMSLRLRAFIGGDGVDSLGSCAASVSIRNIVVFGGDTTSTAASLPPSVGFFDQVAVAREGIVGIVDMGSSPELIDLGYIGGNGNDTVTDVAMNAAGAVAVVGTTQNVSGFPFRNSLQNVSAAANVAFLAYGAGVHEPLVSTWFGGDAQLQPVRADVDQFGQVHIVGHAGSGVATTLGALQPVFGGAIDAFYARFGFQQVPGLTIENPGFHYVTYLGGPGNESVGGVRVNGSEVLISASSSGGFPISIDGQSRTPNGSQDAVIAAIRPSVTDFPVVVNLPPGGSGVGFAGITGPLPLDVTLQLGSSSSKLVLPETVVVPAGQTQTSFLMYTRDVLSTETVTVSSFWDGQLRQSFMEIAAPGFGGVINLDGANGSLRPTTVDLEFREAGLPNVLITKTVAVAPDGTFLTDAPSNRVFDVSVKPGHWLRRTVRFDTRPGAISGAAISLLNGDCNGDNTVSIADFLLLRQAFGASAGDPRFNPNADLNRDGSIGIGDFLLLRRNFGRSGDQ